MRTSKYNRIPMVVLIAASFLAAISCTDNKEITSKESEKHVKYLSSDLLQGRLTGSEGDSLAAEYIRKEFRSSGLVPLVDDGFQRFSVTRRLVPGNANSLAVNGTEYKTGDDFSPAGFTSNGSAEAGLAFAGYGFNINNDSIQWDDYRGLDIKGKWVLVLSGEPQSDNPSSPYLQAGNDRNKALAAKDMGASGVLLVSGPAYDPDDEFDPMNPGDLPVGLPVIRIRRSVADEILKTKGISVASIEEKLNKSLTPASFNAEVIIKATAEAVREMSSTRNVVMMLPGEDKTLTSEYIIIGAHFDHLGLGGPGSSSRAVDTTGVHHGADDNASGVSLMLELAEKMAETEGDNKRSVVFIAFSGEEMGLLGSKYYVENAGIDLSKVNAMINLDMVGRLNETNNIQIGGTGTSPSMKEVLTSLNDTNLLKLSLSEEGYGPSDHSSFYGKNIPVLFFSTGAHLDYHTPADTYDKINYQGMVSVGDLVYRTASFMANDETRLQFTEAGPNTSQSGQMRRRGVTLGIMPDFAGNISNGLRADFVTPGKPAALGGMKKGDIITAINGLPVNNIQDYMFRMGQLKHGQTINVEINRNGESILLLIQL